MQQYYGKLNARNFKPFYCTLHTLAVDAGPMSLHSGVNHAETGFLLKERHCQPVFGRTALALQKFRKFGG